MKFYFTYGSSGMAYEGGNFGAKTREKITITREFF